MLSAELDLKLAHKNPPEKSTKLPDHKVLQEENFGKSALQQMEAGFLQWASSSHHKKLLAGMQVPVGRPAQGKGPGGLPSLQGREAGTALMPRRSATSERPFLTLCWVVDGRSKRHVPV